MKLKFDSTLDYQLEAIGAVVDIFEGQPLASPALSIMRGPSYVRGQKQLNEEEILCIGNDCVLGPEDILDNIRKVQEINDIEQSSQLAGMHFSVEMETGTGKTYVYLRTILELNKRYGFSKFVIVVPSIAIREGVKKSIDITRDHLEALYSTRIKSFVYSPTDYGNIRQFATDTGLQIMVVNIQAFQRDTNLMHREGDKLSRKPIEFFQATRPILILDEPQNMESEGARAALESFRPLCTLRYSATHKNPYNLLYKLDPIRAYDLRLVKRIEVDFPVESSENVTSDAYVKVESIDNRNGFKARLKINVQKEGGPARKTVTVTLNKDLYTLSAQRQEYRHGWQVQNISLEPGFEGVAFANGIFVPLHQEVGGFGEDLMRLQVRETVRRHLEKERRLKDKGIKVLSLFFIDRVANYRVYNPDGSHSLGKIGQWFEEAYTELTSESLYTGILPWKAAEVHGGYFSQDKSSKRLKDSTERGSKDDEDTYALIMRDKERLLSPDEPLRFIFSHSALREGWDNPNVFQICTLNESASTDRKRQEIGRGLRLPVNTDGERVRDEAVNILTVIANENYNDFVRKLQTEYEEDCGIVFGKVPAIAFAKLPNPIEDGNLGQEESRKLWEHLCKNGILGDDGIILDSFRPDHESFVLPMPEHLQSLEPLVIDAIKNYILKNRIGDSRIKRTLRYQKQVELSEDFRELWNRISRRTRYRVKFATDELVQEAARRIKAAPEIQPVTIIMERRLLEQSAAGLDAETILEQRSYQPEWGDSPLPDILAYLQDVTELTRATLVDILAASGRLGDFYTNPQAFMTLAAREITRVLHGMTLGGIHYEPIDEHWDMMRLEKDAENELKCFLSNLYEVKNVEKSLYDHIELQSEVERRFARDLDNNERVKLFVKLPRWFTVDTPIGTYNPDWAIVVTSEGDRGERLYLVRETKSTLDAALRRDSENQKILCGEKHFGAIGVDFKVATSVAEVVGQCFSK